MCNSVSYGIRPIIACLPAWFRFAQCLRRYRDTRLVFPHIVNAGKYSTSFFVVIFSSLYQAYIGMCLHVNSIIIGMCLNINSIIIGMCLNVNCIIIGIRLNVNFIIIKM